MATRRVHTLRRTTPAAPACRTWGRSIIAPPLATLPASAPSAAARRRGCIRGGRIMDAPSPSPALPAARVAARAVGAAAGMAAGVAADIPHRGAFWLPRIVLPPRAGARMRAALSPARRRSGATAARAPTPQGACGTQRARPPATSQPPSLCPGRGRSGLMVCTIATPRATVRCSPTTSPAARAIQCTPSSYEATATADSSSTTSSNTRVEPSVRFGSSRAHVPRRTRPSSPRIPVPSDSDQRSSHSRRQRSRNRMYLQRSSRTGPSGVVVPG